MKTNAARILDGLGIPYELRDYAVDPNDLAAASVARKIGLPPEQIFKTLLSRVDGEPVFALVAGDAELHLKKLAALAGGRKAELMPLANVEPLTGYIRGGVTILGAKKFFPVFADSALLNFDTISVSAGTRGTQLVLSPQDYLTALERNQQPATLGDISRPLSGEKS